MPQRTDGTEGGHLDGVVRDVRVQLEARMAHRIIAIKAARDVAIDQGIDEIAEALGIAILALSPRRGLPHHRCPLCQVELPAAGEGESDE